MNPNVIHVEVMNTYHLKLTFENEEVRVFDVAPFLEKGIFQELKEMSYFKQASVAFGGIQWPHEQDFSKDTLYLLSSPEIA
ncbi:DUF2442 domain-containing protein [Marinomonas transparens]|uniref:DUF2442 domain-containing protein n=1 Tax=Marinomonas transparens TaxID=2795388 RepID=A0A934JUS9_9GAMM|nr:DUF2442 domain-containing protein [Marinomonas transparens]MBJ7538682.1 DUF2442 domain-containing protein [Marinomonas transparens]